MGTGREKVWWTVATDCGTRRTIAASRAKAIRNVRYRLVMDDRSYDRPRPRDFAEMRDIEIIKTTCEESAERSSHPPSGASAEGGSTRGAVRAGEAAQGRWAHTEAQGHGGPAGAAERSLAVRTERERPRGSAALPEGMRK